MQELNKYTFSVNSLNNPFKNKSLKLPDTNSTLSEDVKIVIVYGDEAVEEKISKIELYSSGWYICPITEMIGDSVMVKHWWTPCQKKPPSETGLLLLVNPVTGIIPNEWQNDCGIFAFARTDRTDMSVQLFWQIYSYIKHLKEYYYDDIDEEIDFVNFKKNKLNYQSFREYTYNDIFKKMCDSFQSF